MTDLCDIGVIGLAVMGANLARNAARKGFGVALYNRHGSRTDALMSEHGHEGRFTPSKEIADFVASLAKPRAMIIMVKAGQPVDDVIAELVPHREEGDVVLAVGSQLDHEGIAPLLQRGTGQLLGGGPQPFQADVEVFASSFHHWKNLALYASRLPASCQYSYAVLGCQSRNKPRCRA